MIKDGRFIGKTPFMYTMSEIQGWDLDYPWQLDLARTLVKFKYVSRETIYLPMQNFPKIIPRTSSLSVSLVILSMLFSASLV